MFKTSSAYDSTAKGVFLMDTITSHLTDSSGEQRNFDILPSDRTPFIVAPSAYTYEVLNMQSSPKQWISSPLQK
ncbi:hypothetical protein AAC387_Pa09g0407 [Persea americana]